MHTRLATALLAALLALPALADDPPAPHVPPPPGSWNLGAGVGYGGLLAASSLGNSGLNAGLVLAAPFASASLERRLSDDLWFVVGGSVTASRATTDAPGALVQRDEIFQGAIVAGLRQVVTPRGAPVSIGWIGLARIDTGRRNFAWQSGSPGTSIAHERLGGLGASVGLSVERELTERIALRVSTPLFAANWSRRRSESVDGTRSTTRGASISATVAPSLELRLAF